VVGFVLSRLLAVVFAANNPYQPRKQDGLFSGRLDMRWLLLPGLIAAASLLPVQEDAAKKDLAAMQGTWTLVSMEVDGQAVKADKLKSTTLTIKDSKYTLLARQQQHEVELTLDPSKTPKAIDMKFLDGPNKDRVGRGIYQIEGKTLKICRGLDPQQDRPESFKTQGQINCFVMVWDRE
jgi:uncharacterized protein (TIGR03067 family)